MYVVALQPVRSANWTYEYTNQHRPAVARLNDILNSVEKL